MKDPARKSATSKKKLAGKSSTSNPAFEAIENWFHSQKWQPQEFQRETWAHMIEGRSGLLNAATGTGKTYAIWGGVIAHELLRRQQEKIPIEKLDQPGLRAIWITPLRSLANEIADSAQTMCDGIGLPWKVGSRTGDTKQKERAAQKKQLPHLLVTTPESLHVLLATKGYADLFKR
nr:DEAD/DEAH box helicase [Bacteroidota bacterium]